MPGMITIFLPPLEDYTLVERFRLLGMLARLALRGHEIDVKRVPSRHEPDDPAGLPDRPSAPVNRDGSPRKPFEPATAPRLRLDRS